MKQFERNCVLNKDLAEYTSWKIGGPADIFFMPNSRSDLSHFLGEYDDDVVWLGNGTNALVRDGGIRGAVISTRKSFNKIELIDKANHFFKGREQELRIEIEKYIKEKTALI